VGTLASRLARVSRRRALENLEHAFAGEKTPRELRRICRGVFRTTAINVLELLVIHRWSPEKIRRVFGLAADFQRLQDTCAGGTVGVTGHFGSWELQAVLFGCYHPGRLRPVAKRIYFEKFQSLVERFRQKAGLEVIYTDESPRRLVEALEAGKLLGMLPDQNLKAVSGVFVEFFGRPAYTSTAPVHLALTTGSRLVATYLVREGGRFRVLIHEIPLQKTGRREEDLRENTRRWTRVFEEEIRRYPDQWVWFHRRWRTRPEDGVRKVGRRRAPARLVPEGGTGSGDE
jgi:KDO2-lipid IV(A) lauroyltransferase